MEKLGVNIYLTSSGGKFYLLEFGNVCNLTEEYITELINYSKNMSFNKYKIKILLLIVMIVVTFICLLLK